MKTLLILRHGKAKRGPEHPSDADRPLTKRGKEDATRAGQACREMGLLPDIVLSSPAKRARQTAEHFCEAAGCGGEVDFQDRVYKPYVPQNPAS